MNINIKAALRAVGMTKWFILTSWVYMSDNKLHYFKGLVPAWARFTLSTYRDMKELEK